MGMNEPGIPNSRTIESFQVDAWKSKAGVGAIVVTPLGQDRYVQRRLMIGIRMYLV